MDVEDELPTAPASADGGESSHALVSGDQFDVEAYAAQYSGRTRVARLLFIAEKCGSEQMRLGALRLAYDWALKGEDTALHRDVSAKIAGRLGPRYAADQAWVALSPFLLDAISDALACFLKSFYLQTNLIKESIGMGYNDLGDFHYAQGHLSDAFKSYIRTRDYCTTSKHVVQMCLNVILVSIELGQFMHVSNYVIKAEQTPDDMDPITAAKLRAAAGLAYMETNKYKLAARKFIETGSELRSNYSEVIAPQDVAVYGALCALASFDRSELKSKVIDNYNFRNFLELVPEVRELVNDFYASRYGSCLGYLEKLKSNLLLDMHLHAHIETLYKDIRHKAIIQYTFPFISVDLNLMAVAFQTSVSLLEKELAALITDNKIQARIDSHNKILYASHADQRNGTFQRALQTGIEFERDVKSMLLRANLLKHEYSQKAAERKV
ncbi:unnamed protein product [Triticum turgidum subsp. durum]|uniref:PCI domain-containing protein n=1 Tax=Triticum turgidum subsp. durum TaxID=4567 RepID=A0A9R0QV08_TRITD|nr:unnamed protein product [Triticum turgidum subsp. durum]